MRLTLLSLSLILIAVTAAALGGASDTAPASEAVVAGAAIEATAPDAAAAVAGAGHHVEVDCAVAAEPREKEVKEGDPVQSSNPHCICPHAGAGWTMTGDSCTLDAGGATCSGTCNWHNSQQNTRTTTPCGTP